ncbi:hypothetical protein [Sphaerisporangium rhizosphaerae]|uniref:DUF1876 domain-containing protein n=1 Tax=Sphaerisporangium rhizosphaerae TaxID=2269375 RepID=A0ABW2P0C0_9ACTN
MSYRPYTYVTVTLEPDRDPRVSVTYHTGELRIRTAVIDGKRPYLSMEAARGMVSISTTGAGPVTDQDITVARELFTAAARYLADCERLQAAQTDPAGPCETAA